MPLTKTGKEILKNFEDYYGMKAGKRAFYSYMNKYPRQTKSWHK